MPMNNELRLISRLVRDRDLTPALERGIDKEWFQEEEARRYWEHVLKHWNKYSEVPTVNALKLTFPGSSFPRIEDTADYLVDEFVAWRRRKETVRILQDAREMVVEAENHEAALVYLTSELAKISEVGESASSDLDLMSGIEDRIQRYLDLEGAFEGGLRGLPTGFPTIDRATSGLQPQQLVTLVALPKTGKSTLALLIADYMHRQGKRVLFITYEMSPAEQESRWIAIRAGVSHTRLMSGRLTRQEKLRVKALKQLRDHEDPNAFVISDAVSAGTVSGITAKLVKIRPDIVFVDGAYLVRDEITGEYNTPQALTNITRAFKRMAQRFNIPVLLSTQALAWKVKGKNVGADAIGYSSSFYQDSDVILSLQRTADDRDDERILRVDQSRNCGKEQVNLIWDWEHASFREPVMTAAGGGGYNEDDT